MTTTHPTYKPFYLMYVQVTSIKPIAHTDWKTLKSQDIDTFAQNMTEKVKKVISLSNSCIPNRSI